MLKILKCKKCGNYTLKEICSCKERAITPKPAKFSLPDKYASYRRKIKFDSLKEKGYI